MRLPLVSKPAAGAEQGNVFHVFNIQGLGSRVCALN